MDQEKIGKFISIKRKEKGITQSELAELLGISDRAISKWENGNCLPDASNMQELCKILNITINDLFSGEVVDMEDNVKRLEENLLEMTKLKEQRDKELLLSEIFICVSFSIMLCASVLIVNYIEMDNWLKFVIVLSTVIPFAIGVLYALRIEQIAGYYECSNCHHKYIPSYKTILFAMHINRTRRMKCPHCNKKTWHKKKIK